MGAKRPIAKADTTAVSMAADFAIERAGSSLPADPNTLVRVGYLRRVPDHIEPILKAAWPWAVVKWTTIVHQHTAAQRRIPRAVLNRHVVYPLVLLEPFLEFLNPSGACHLARINKGLACDRDTRAVDLDTIPDKDPDF